MKDSSTSDVMQPEGDGEVREITAKEAQAFFGKAKGTSKTRNDCGPKTLKAEKGALHRWN
jgi:hypothetical protein